MEEPKGRKIDNVSNACHYNRIILQVFASDMDCYDKIDEIDKTDVYRIEYDKDDKEGAVKALREFTGNVGSSKQDAPI